MSDVWNTYRTRFLVKAQQLTDPITFTDVLGREHHGNPGDYLVQSSHGLRVAPRWKGEMVELPSPSTEVSNPESLAS